MEGKLHGKGTETRADSTVREGEFVEGDGSARRLGRNGSRSPPLKTRTKPVSARAMFDGVISSEDMATCLAMTQSVNEGYRQKIAYRRLSQMREHLKALVAEAHYTAARCHDGPRMMMSWSSALTPSQATSIAKRAAAAAERFEDEMNAVLVRERATAREHPGIVVNSAVSRQQSELYAAAAERTREVRNKRKRAYTAEFDF